jgi:hypothetical protein
MEQWKKKRNIERYEKLEYRFYIFCEGEQTEPNYFKGFKKLIEEDPIYRKMVLITIEPCGAETMRVIGQAEDYIRKNKINRGQVWCVYDKDSFPAERFNGVSQKARLLSSDNLNLQYHVAWSNECIEYWFLLHFANYISNNDRICYCRFLDKEFKKYKLGKYEKNNINIFDILLEYGNPKLAIRYAKTRISSFSETTDSDIAPGTMVYKLVEELAKYLPEEIRNKFI